MLLVSMPRKRAKERGQTAQDAAVLKSDKVQQIVI